MLRKMTSEMVAIAPGQRDPFLRLQLARTGLEYVASVLALDPGRDPEPDVSEWVELSQEKAAAVKRMAAEIGRTIATDEPLVN